MKISVSFKKVFNAIFSEALTKVKDVGPQKKLSKSERKLTIRKHRRQEKQHITQQWQENEALTFLGNRKSFSQHEAERKSLFFETKDDALKRTEKRKAEEDCGKAKKKRHSPDHNLLNFDKAGLLDEVESITVHCLLG